MGARVLSLSGAHQRQTIRALDGRADVWLHPGAAGLPPAVQLDVDDEAIAGRNERTTLGLSLTPHQARELGFVTKEEWCGEGRG